MIVAVLPSSPATAIRIPTRRCAAAANEASTTAPARAAPPSLAPSQLPSVTSGADMAGSVGSIARSSTGDSVAPCPRVAEAMTDGAPTLLTPGSASSLARSVP